MNPFDAWNSQDDVVDINKWMQMQQMANAKPKQTATPAPKSKKGSKNQNFLSSLISEAGGTGGAIGGAAIGTALLPGIGTLLGAGIGGFAGGFGGRAVENQVRDGEMRVGDALTEGAISGVMGAGPIRLLKGGAAGVKALKGGSKAATSLDDVVGEVAQAPLKTSFKGKLADKGTDLLTGQYPTLTAPMARATNLKENVGKLADMGIYKPEDAERIASQLTNADGIINKAVLTATGNASRVPTANVGSVAQRAIEDIGLVDSDAKSVLTIVNAQMKRLGNSGDAEPAKVLTVMKSLEKRIADLKGKGGNAKLTDPVREDKAKALLAVRDELRNQLEVSAGANKNLKKVLTPEFRESIVGLFPDEPLWMKHVDDNIMTAENIGALRSSMAPFVNISKAIDAGDINAVTAGGRLGNALQNGAGVGNLLTAGALDLIKDPASRMAGQALRKAGGVGPQAAASAGIQGPGKLGITRNILGVGAFGAGLGAVQPAEATGLDQAIQIDEPQQDQMFGGAGDMTTENQTPWLENGTSGPLDQMTKQPVQQSPYPKENLLMDIQRDPKNADYYMKRYKEFEEIFAPAEDDMAEMNTSTQNALKQSDLGLNTIQQLEDAFMSAGGGSGRQMGWVQNKISNHGLNPQAAVYNKMAGGSVSQLARALGETGTISDTDTANYSQLLPQITDTPAEARYKFEKIRQRLQAARQATATYGGFAAPQEEEQMQGAY